jgi:thioredoxin 1
MIRKIDENGFDLANENGISVVAFSAKWCPPCKVMGPIYEEAAAKFPGYNFLKADQDDVPAFFRKFGVQSIPTYLVLKDGKEVHRRVGALPGSRFQAMLETFS